MSTTYLCPECRTPLRLRDDFADDVIYCHSCGATFPANSPRARPQRPTDLDEGRDQRPKSSRVRRRFDDDDDERDRANRRFDDERNPKRRQWEDDGRRRSNGKGPGVFIWFVVAILLIGGFSAIAAWIVPREAPGPLAGKKENEDERRNDIRNALVELKPLTDAELAAELRTLFTNVGAAFRAQDGDQVILHFDVERMAEEFLALAPDVVTTRKDRGEFTRGLKTGMKGSVAKWSQAFQWRSFEIRSVKKLSDMEAMAIIRHEHPTLGTLKMRWWVSRREGTWKIFDYEDLDSGMRWSIIAASMMRQGIGQMAGLAHSLSTLNEAVQAFVAQDVDAAERKLKQIAGVNLPREIDALRHTVTGAVLIRRGEFKQGLTAMVRANELRPEMPVVDLLSGAAYNRLGEYDKALKHLEKYRELLGDDAQLCDELGLAVHNLRRFKEAIPLYRKSLDFEPKNTDCFARLIRALGDEGNHDDIGERFAKLDDPRENFELFAADCQDPPFDKLLQKLIDSMRKIDPGYPPVDYYASLIKARALQTAEAASLFKSALKREQDPKKRKDYADGFVKVMISVGKIEEAYRVVPNASEAFPSLALQSLKSYRFDQLKRLTAVHSQKHAADPILHWYQAAIYCWEGRYELAEKTFAAALRQPPDDETLKQLRASRVDARYHVGKMMSAYREIGPRQETFNQLANLSFYDENYDQLQTLLDAHAQTNPNDIELLSYRIRLKCTQGQLPEAITLLNAILKKDLSKEDRDKIVVDFLSAAAEAGKPVEAYRAAPDAREAFRQLASNLEEENRNEELHQLIEAHRAKDPPDSWIAVHEASLHEIDEAWDKVIAVLKPAMKQAPEEVKNIYRWRYMTAMYKTGCGMQAYSESQGEARELNWIQLANLMVQDKKEAELQALIAAHRPNSSKTWELDYYGARAMILAKRPGEAVALLGKAISAPIEEWQRNSYQSGFLSAMAEAGFALEGFRAAPDKTTAFETLAYQLIGQKKEKELETLLKEREREGAADAAQEHFWGELHFLRGDFKKAEQRFAAASVKEAPSEFKRSGYRLNLTRVKAGNAVRAYEESEKGSQEFEQLAAACVQEKDSRQLQGLIDVHRRLSPDDSKLPQWEADALWLKQDYDGLVKRLNANRADFATPAFRWKFDGYLIRSLVRLKRTRDAIQEAESLAKKRSSNAMWLVLAHAASADVKSTIAVLAKQRIGGRQALVETCYRDEDLGPILKSEPFRELREKFPEPKERRFPRVDDPDDM